MHLHRTIRTAVVIACLGVILNAGAQPAQPPAQDPLMSLMLAQPRLDLDAPVRAAASFDPPLVRVGQKSIYRVTLSALEQSIQFTNWPSATPALPLEPGARGQVLQMSNTNMEPRTTFNFRAVSKSPGTFQVPEFTLLAYGKPVKVPAAQLQVSPAEAYVPDRAQDLSLELATTNLWVGQPVTARILLKGSLGGIVQGISQVQINGMGLMADMGAVRQRIENVGVGTSNVAAYVYETLITPVAAGNIGAFAQAFTVGNRFAGPITISSGQITIPSGPPEYLLLQSDVVPLNVRPLPRAGELPGFTGAIGEFALDPARLSTNRVAVGEPVKLIFSVRTPQNQLARLSPPPAPRSREWQILEPGSDGNARQIAAQSVTTFEYTLIPLVASVTSTPKIPFSYFNPARGEHVDLSVPPLPVTVYPGEVAAEYQALVEAAKVEDAAEEASLGAITKQPGRQVSSLVPLQQRAWFPLVQLAPAVIFLGLWRWDRRRRYLEAHPEIVLRHQALRDLKRERRGLARAAAARDPEAFLDSAVKATRFAAAPHYPAAPRALVCTDILELLTPSERVQEPGIIVRRLFNMNDSREFHADAVSPQILQLGRDVNSLLDLLEERLQRFPSKPAPKMAGEEELDPEADALKPEVARLALWLAAGLLLTTTIAATQREPTKTFAEAFAGGVFAYEHSNYPDAVLEFRKAAGISPCTGAFQNLGNAEWQRGRTGPAIQAWEQALYIDPWNVSARQSLQFARKTAQLEAPQLGWFEVVASWLPLNSWVWIAGASLWAAVGMLTLPGILRLKRQGWHQAVAALGFAVFLLSMPAHLGTHTRTRQGFVMLNNTSLRLTPTGEAQEVTKLTSGDPVRVERTRGEYILVRGSQGRGWLHQDETGRITAIAK